MSLDDKIRKGYDERFTKKDINIFFKNKIKPEVANRYKRFDAFEILQLLKVKCDPKLADKYNPRFNGWDINKLVAEGCCAGIANRYPEKFKGRHIAKLFNVNCFPSDLNKYASIYSAEQIVIFYSNNYSQDMLNQYDERFIGDEAHLINIGCPPHIANKYHEELNTLGIQILYNSNVMPDDIDKKRQKKLKNLFENLFWLKKINNYTKYNLINTGGSSIIFLDNDKNTAWKYSDYDSAHKEARLLRRIRSKHKHNLKNIIRIKKRVDQDPYYHLAKGIELEHIKGSSLENILKEKGKLPQDRVLRYSAGIMNGLIEMRKAGIWYHRDIRPANIMIDEDRDEAVIIDLGIATEDKRALSKHNRRYGSKTGQKANDIISLAQVMYKMATGEHLFAKSKSMELSIYAKNLKDHRDEVYAHPERLRYFLRKVDENIKDETIKKLIKDCLTAKHYHYKKMHRKFKPNQQSQSDS